MKQPSKEPVRVLVSAMSNFAVVAFGVGAFEQKMTGIILGCYFLALALIIQRAVPPPSGRGYKAHLNWNFDFPAFVC